MSTSQIAFIDKVLTHGLNKDNQNAIIDEDNIELAAAIAAKKAQNKITCIDFEELYIEALEKLFCERWQKAFATSVAFVSKDISRLIYREKRFSYCLHELNNYQTDENERNREKNFDKNGDKLNSIESRREYNIDPNNELDNVSHDIFEAGRALNYADEWIMLMIRYNQGYILVREIGELYGITQSAASLAIKDFWALIKIRIGQCWGLWTLDQFSQKQIDRFFFHKMLNYKKYKNAQVRQFLYEK